MGALPKFGLCQNTGATDPGYSEEMIILYSAAGRVEAGFDSE